jgi:hypothetical protein
MRFFAGCRMTVWIFGTVSKLINLFNLHSAGGKESHTFIEFLIRRITYILNKI